MKKVFKIIFGWPLNHLTVREEEIIAISARMAQVGIQRKYPNARVFEIKEIGEYNG